MHVFALIGCTGVLRSDEGTDPVRGALWFPEVPIHSDVVPHVSLVLLSNSPMTCEPDPIKDDPSTEADEAAASELYWQAEITAAFTREDTLLVLLALYTRSAGWDGEYDLVRTAYESPGEAIATRERTGFGAWLHVEEAEVNELDGLFYLYEPITYAYNYAVEAPASAEIETEGTSMRGDFSFDLDHLSGKFRAEECRNAALYNQIWGIAQELGVDPTAIEDLAD